MFETKPIQSFDIKRFLFFRFLTGALWAVDVFSFLFLPISVFLGCILAHLWVASRCYRGYLRIFLILEDAAAKT